MWAALTLAATTVPMHGFGKCMWGAARSTSIWHWPSLLRGGPLGRLRAAGVGAQPPHWSYCQFTQY